MDNARFLVTGGCGLQGSHIVQQLIDSYPNSSIHVLSRHPTKQFDKVTCLTGDASITSDVSRAMDAAKPSVVFHVAGLNADETCGPEVFKAVNLEATRILLAESQKHKVRAFLFTSSSAVVSGLNGSHLFKDFKDLDGIDETALTAEIPNDECIHPYTKAESERLVKAADTPGGMRTVSIRSALIYGERDTKFIPMFMGMLAAGKTNTRLGDGRNRIAFTYAGNSAKAQLMMAERLVSGKSNDVGAVAGQVFFVTDKESTNFHNFGRSIWAAAGHPIAETDIRTISKSTALWMAYFMGKIAWLTGSKPALTDSIVLMSTSNRWFKNDKVERALGFKQPYTQEEGVKRSVEWFQENKEKQDKEAK